MTSNRIHPSAVISDAVELGAGVTVGPNAVILGPAEIADRVWIGPGVVIGTPPEIADRVQNAAWTGEVMHTGVRIGEGTVIRELTTIHQGSHRTTTIGSNCWILNSSYVAHDCLIGDGVTISAGTRLGGHVIVGDIANLGMSVVVHQHRVIGAGAMVGMGTPITRDVPPFTKAYGNPPRLHGVNEYALRRLSYDDETIDRVRDSLLAADPSVLAGGLAAAPVREWLELAQREALTVMGVEE
ncbi:acyl-ACP--UDP-N- acetylglucosamine O-acyltransferase [Microbacterium immunditiarum]|uniref:UDP-N-acetylglucosamine acyltransferase n=1 Tax=Microbacterium immunditiarum TaxID=337480 RepID=A0A7Y9GQV9_9MICO|nr:acyl-ACP--UDP-N- acetylglucosamine O-acyltransferase [Microbacterium immunditiarum]NYE21030.1 UDP-N-acetylglucosamine acyltransferase [Microbacterium immunditiarum]